MMRNPSTEYNTMPCVLTKNPMSNMSAQVPANTIGFFIAQSAEEVKR